LPRRPAAPGRRGRAIRRHSAERVIALGRGLEGPRPGGVDRAGLDEAAPEIHQLVEHLDLEGAGSDARRAGGARPRRVGGDEARERLPVLHRAERRLDDLPRVERLSRGRRRAHRGAPAAADARGGVEELRPGEAHGQEGVALRRGRRQAARRAELTQRQLRGRGDHVAEDRRADQAEEEPAERRVRPPERPVEGRIRQAAGAESLGQRPPDE
jgi:hypothetical protein